MSHIFVSYSRKDIDFAGRIVQALAENNLDTWIDWKSIPKGVDNLPITILVLRNYDRKHETNLADKARKIFIQFADAIVMADKNENPYETIAIAYFKEILNAE